MHTLPERPSCMGDLKIPVPKGQRVMTEEITKNMRAPMGMVDAHDELVAYVTSLLPEFNAPVRVFLLPMPFGSSMVRIYTWDVSNTLFHLRNAGFPDEKLDWVYKMSDENGPRRDWPGYVQVL